MTKTELPIKDIKVGNRARKDLGLETGEMAKLIESIRTNGLLQSLTVDKDYNLVTGGRRLYALTQLGYDTVPVRVVDVPSILKAELDENDIRKDFTYSERVAIGQAIEEELRRQAEAKAQEAPPEEKPPEEATNGQTEETGKKKGKRKGKKAEEEAATPEETSHPTADTAAEQAGFGNRETYRQAKTVIEDAIAEVVELMDKEVIAPYLAAKIARLTKAKQKQVASLINAGIKPAKAIKQVTEPEEAKDQQDAKDVLDELGGLVPKNLVPVFEGVDTFDDLVKQINAINRQIDELRKAPAGSLMEGKAQAIKTDLENAKKQIRFYAPYCVCPKCAGKGKKNCVCKEKGYINKATHENLPPEAFVS